MRFARILPVLFAVSAFRCCTVLVPEELSPSPDVEIPLVVNPCGGDVKSSAGTGSLLNEWETEIRNFTVFQYRDSLLEKAVFSNSSAGRIGISMMPGATYHFYAVVNCGDITPLFAEGSRERDLIGHILEFEAVPSVSAAGMPMAGTAEATLPVTSVEIPVSRLYSKIGFRTGNGTSGGRLALEHGSFLFRSIRIRNASRRISPFRVPYSEEDRKFISDGDCASEADIDAVNGGGAISLYSFENARENALPGSPFCTYIEAEGTYSDRSGALIVDAVMRLIPGTGGIRYDIPRNGVHDVRLTLTDSHGYKDSTWHLEPVVHDVRTLAFAQPSYSLVPGIDTPVDLLCNGFPASGFPDLCAAFGLRYSVSANLSACGVGFDPSRRTLSVGSPPERDVFGTLTATSWDGRQNAVTTVVVRRGADIGGDGDDTGTGSGQIDY